MSAKSRPLVRAAAALFAATMLGSMPAASFAASEAAPIVKQVPPSIRVVAAERRELVETLSVNGTIVSREEAAVGTDLNGLTVIALNADEGDLVKKGDVLAVLDRSMLDTQLAQIEASRAQAEANIAQMRAQIGDTEVGVRQAKEALDRAVALQKKGVATDAQRDNAVNALDSSRAKLDSAEKALKASEAQRQSVLVQIAKTELRAPADGLILARDATLGGVVMAQTAPLFRIAINGEFELAATVAETALPRLANGMAAEVTMSGLDEAVAGTIRRISPEVDHSSRLGSIRIALKPGSPARAGNFARGEIELIRREGVAVPASAVMYAGPVAFLQCVEGGKVKTQAVTLGARAGEMVEIVSGIGEGEEVVSRAGTFVADGDLVTPVRVEATGAVKP